MKRLLCFLLFACPSVCAFGQEPAPQVPPNATIERVDITGLDENKLSPDLRSDIQKLTGQPYNAQTIEALTQDIQVEFPEYVAAATTQPGTQPDRIRVAILVAKIADNDALKNNINSRYIVDAIEFEGLKLRISDELNAEFQQMVGQNVDSAQLNKLTERIQRENSSIMVSWKLRRSSQPQHVNVVYEARKARNTLTFNVLRGTYHSRQGFGGQIFGMQYTHIPTGTLSFSMWNSADEYVERYAGYRAGYSIGTDFLRLRFSVDYSSFRSQWKTNTLEADRLSPHSPGLYRLRDTLSGQISMSYPITASTLISGSAKVDFAELQMQSPTLGFQKSNALRGSLTASYVRSTGSERLNWKGSYDGAAGTAAIDSDFIFSRHEAKFDFNYTWHSHSILGNFQAGRIGGKAPMHERFSIGNAKTLRGWNKYEINPLGGDRVVYGSVSYRYKIITGFYDVGSVWEVYEESIVRQSVGFRLAKARCMNVLILPNPACFSATVGFPINGGDAGPSFILGMGF
jgi:outer membrane translocation and assembly module TamA